MIFKHKTLSFTLLLCGLLSSLCLAQEAPRRSISEQNTAIVQALAHLKQTEMIQAAKDTQKKSKIWVMYYHHDELPWQKMDFFDIKTGELFLWESPGHDLICIGVYFFEAESPMNASGLTFYYDATTGEVIGMHKQ